MTSELNEYSLDEPFDYFYFSFGQLRHALWKTAPKIKEYMLTGYIKDTKDDEEEEILCHNVYEILKNAKSRFTVLEGKDKFSLQLELLEWLSCDSEEIEIEYTEYPDKSI